MHYLFNRFHILLNRSAFFNRFHILLNRYAYAIAGLSVAFRNFVGSRKAASPLIVQSAFNTWKTFKSSDSSRSDVTLVMVCERLEHSFKRRLAVDSKQQSPGRLAQSAERKALNLVAVGSGPTVGVF